MTIKGVKNYMIGIYMSNTEIIERQINVFIRVSEFIKETYPDLFDECVAENRNPLFYIKSNINKDMTKNETSLNRAILELENLPLKLREQIRGVLTADLLRDVQAEPNISAILDVSPDLTYVSKLQTGRKLRYIDGIPVEAPASSEESQEQEQTQTQTPKKKRPMKRKTPKRKPQKKDSSEPSESEPLPDILVDPFIEDARSSKPKRPGSVELSSGKGQLKPLTLGSPAQNPINKLRRAEGGVISSLRSSEIGDEALSRSMAPKRLSQSQKDAGHKESAERQAEAEGAIPQPAPNTFVPRNSLRSN